MGEIAVNSKHSLAERNAFVRHLLRDVQALDQMLEADFFEKGVRRIGAEQELCLIQDNYEPAFTGPEILETIADEHFTTEIGRFNLEINLDPHVADSDCLRKMQIQLLTLLQFGDNAAAPFHSHILLTGILPTLGYANLLENAMTPKPRYFSLSETVRQLRGSDFEIRLLGVDELIASLPSLMFEACNTSFQLHLQIDAADFVAQYNWAQLIAAPVLGISANSPLLFGRELWAETRIALFHQSVDTRTSSNHYRQKQPRVFFGNNWLRESVAEIFKDNIARFPTILTKEVNDDSLEQLAAGIAPSLAALRVHNGTTYPWNRPCYGITNGVPHLRIECRYIPSGPTIADEMANFAFWLGLMLGMPDAYKNLPERMPFRVAKGNFYRAARTGLDTNIEWFGKTISISQLILNELLPIAKEGLDKINIPAEEAKQYLDCIAGRAWRQQNGATWQMYTFRKLHEHYSLDASLSRLTAALYERQQQNDPVHNWQEHDLATTFVMPIEHDTVGKIMTTDLFTLQEEECAVLAKSLMEWKKIRHLPIENTQGELVGLITATNLQAIADLNDTLVQEIMVKNLVTITPDAPVALAVEWMKTKGINCLPVLENGKMIGIITDTDLKRLNFW